MNIFDPDAYEKIMLNNAILLKWPIALVRNFFYNSRPIGGEIRPRRAGGCRVIWPCQTFSARTKKKYGKLRKQRPQQHRHRIKGAVVGWRICQEGVNVQYE